MFLEIFEQELASKPPISKRDDLAYIVIEGPNGGGKTDISRMASEIAARNFYEVSNLYSTAEPPPISMEVIQGENVRDYLKSGGAGGDPREELGLFMMARRRVQEASLGNLFTADGINHHFSSSTVSAGTLISDRGMPSSNVYQVRAWETSNPGAATENRALIETAYKSGYLYRYNLVAFIQPSSVRGGRSQDDCFEGRFPEIELYAEEIWENGSTRPDSKEMVWVRNDPSGVTNSVEEPAGCIAAACLGVVHNGQLGLGQKKYIPFKTERWILKQEEIRSGNIVVSRTSKDEAWIELTGELPEH